MKLLFRSYLASLRERDELDAVLPDLLSELGFLVFSRPGRGTAQAGVDVAALGPEKDGVRELYLFTIKRGDITRDNWNDNTPQGLRQSLDSILDKYLPRIAPKRFDHLKVVVCVVFGGDMVEQVRGDVEGYFERYTTECVRFEEWNGDKLADLLMTGVLREDVMPKAVRSHFQKAVAMVDEPQVAYEHYARLLQALAKDATNDKDTVRVARQMYIALWVLYVWARDVDNVESAYLASELLVLRLWDLLRPHLRKKGRARRDLEAVVLHAMRVHWHIANDYLERKILPHTGVRHGLSAACQGRAPADVNLKMFDVLGRLAMSGLWSCWMAERSGDSEVGAKARAHAQRMSRAALELIDNNPALALPLQDNHSIELAMCLMLACRSGHGVEKVQHWVVEMAMRYHYTVLSHGRYPCVFTDYARLVAHPAERSEAYRRDATTGSTLLPTMAAVLVASGRTEEITALAGLRSKALEHCTWQLWAPDETSEEHLCTHRVPHGYALTELPLSGNGVDLLDGIDAMLEQAKGFEELSVINTGNWPILLLACRHFRLPVPPQLWRHLLERPKSPTSEHGATDAAASEPGAPNSPS